MTEFLDYMNIIWELPEALWKETIVQRPLATSVSIAVLIIVIGWFAGYDHYEDSHEYMEKDVDTIARYPPYSDCDDQSSATSQSSNKVSDMEMTEYELQLRGLINRCKASFNRSQSDSEDHLNSVNSPTRSVISNYTTNDILPEEDATSKESSFWRKDLDRFVYVTDPVPLHEYNRSRVSNYTTQKVEDLMKSDEWKEHVRRNNYQMHQFSWQTRQSTNSPSIHYDNTLYSPTTTKSRSSHRHQGAVIHGGDFFMEGGEYSKM